MNEIKSRIKESIEAFAQGSLTEKSLALFKTLGYNTERQSSLDKKTYKSFKDAYLDGNTSFSEEKALVSEWKHIDFLFQLSKEEITIQHGLFNIKQVDRTIIETYLFFVIELSQEHYSRTALSHITREINKIFPMPVMVLFKHGQALTLAVINRRMHKRDDQKDVLEKVTLIKDINIENPHRAHIEILFDLSFQELLQEHKFTNFVELHNAWQKTLDTKELNKKFYKELSNWYFWAMKEVDFPGAALHADKKTLFKEEDKEKEHNAKNLIRLLTRLLFVWFVKEKGLIPEELFDEKYVANELLLNFRPKKSAGASGNITSSYYRAILQNLFFATLNQTMGKREFRKSGQHMNVTNLMRYERYFKDSKKFIQVVEKIVPFMNGGLFECLDRPDLEKKGKQGGDVVIYLDGFSDRDDNPLMVPDYIFFGTEDHVDLSEAYGDKVKEYKNAAVKGLINILKSYKFTVAENTPLEEEVALDPELLGRVFENLLASYNPETKTTARKQTGSFYTPREIVNYMVDESLLAYLKQKLEDAGIKDKEDSLRDLINYSENLNPFNTRETKLLIAAIDNCKILDPACGSGAFPMGILHKLVHVLHKLDPKNALWKQKQIEKAQTQDDVKIRDQLVSDIEAAFENNELDYGRKLYLIENCIYGVDIQPIATQISKLRFFISLIVDQKVDTKKENFGIRPLPNLETKFVAANTLIGIEKPKAQITFGSVEVKALEEQFKDVRHRLFGAKTPATKRKLREEDKELREQMGNLLVKSGWENETARQLAGWDPYDQNTSSPFFDSEWMFGMQNGFDIVIGNPPYIDSEMMVNCGQSDLREYICNNYEYTKGNWDIYIAFFEKAFKLAKMFGAITYITPDKWLTKPFGEILRTNKLNILSVLLKSGRDVFESVGVDSIVTIFTTESDRFLLKDYIDEKVVDNAVIPKNIFSEPFQLDIVFSPYLDILLKVTTGLKPLSMANCLCENACATSDAYKLKEILRTSGNLYDPAEHYKVINTGTIDKFNSRWGKKEMTYLKNKYTSPIVAIKDFHRLFPNAYGEKPKKKKLIIKGLTLLDATLDFKGEYVPGKTTLILSSQDKSTLSFLSIVINSKLAHFYITQRYSSASYNGGVNFTKDMINNLPLPSLWPVDLMVLLANALIVVKDQENVDILDYLFLISNSVVYELYFPEEIKAADAEVLKHLKNLPDLKDDWSDEKKIAVIEKVCKELSDPKHPVSIAMAKMQEVPEVKIIEGRDKYQ